MQANEVRRAFTSFFSERGHSHQPSASLIPHDPTLLFTVAGMVPFKTYFTGEQAPPFERAVTIQKCVRAGGKHNDLDEIGRTSRHFTFFEMMGNFSFGDYFKSEAIAWAWEFVVDVLGLDPERLWVTVHLSDDEAAAIWLNEVGIPAERLQRLDEDNYWKMGASGPCGPCSEIFWDKGPTFGAGGGPEHGGEDRYIEIWNLVFMQFDQQADGSKTPLPKPSIDTGMGLERTVSVLQGVDSVWETDELQSLLGTAAQLTGVDAASASEQQLISLRILADHARSTSMLVSDGVFPSNEARGYVLRRILRRAVRHSYILGVEETNGDSDTVMGQMVDRVVDVMGADYPDLVKNHQFVRDVIDREERRFRETLRTGQLILDAELAKLGDADQPDATDATRSLPGATAFLLHDTYGFPLELTEEITKERGIAVDIEGFRVAMAEQQKRAKDARGEVNAGDTGSLVELVEKHGETEFTGREEIETVAEIIHIDDEVVVLDRTPFYAESGGQIGDTGVIRTDTGEISVTDTRYGVPGLVVHAIESVVGEVTAGQTATAAIDNERRELIRRNHTATHLLHAALRMIVGDHVKQQGSYVGPDRLRFDFSHYQALTPSQITEIEDFVNAEVLANPACQHFETTMDEAQRLGAIAFFGDKYGDVVRVLQAGVHSTELCGGTHVRALGDIGPLRIVSEGSIGSNIRRVEALTGQATIDYFRSVDSSATAAAKTLGVPAHDLLEGVERLTTEAKSLRHEVSSLKQKMAIGQAPTLAAQAVDGVVVARIDGLDRNGLRDLAVSVRDHGGVDAVVLGAALDSGGVALVSAVTPDSRFNAGVLIQDAKKIVGGGGKPADEFAVAGGSKVEALDDALDEVRAAANRS
ncbi:MAG: alanine--tRNA ligase [Acidimicrobiaceae bacterium]|nr:alanine--tRNA ligase [Acidimicrobiaceae bacterium]MYC41288.1 alanine--tRNA ligase [Acidimicrobiaceae bacterium]MYC43714.1 alanine--tRNA ligase [Acidimicrobiaceae bacterium]